MNWLKRVTESKWLVPFLLLIIIVLGSFVVFGRKQALQTGISTTAQLYSCPMHPSVTSDHPDKCPICHMDLQKMDGDVAPSKGGSTDRKKILFYRNPMRADITSPVPAKDEMGMDYIPVYEETDASESTDVTGRSTFKLSNERQQLIGVTTVTVKPVSLNHEIRANGTVAFDPELYSAIEEYRQAAQSKTQMKDSAYDSLKTQSEDLLAASRTKLRLMGLSDAQISRLANSPNNSINLLLPQGNVWVYAEVYEYEMGALKPGQKVEITTPSAPGETFTGKVSSASPVLNAQTRTVRVRALVPDPKRLLRPDSFVNVRIAVDLGTHLAIPADSVLHSGDDDFVFVVKEEGRFEPRMVVLGQKAKDFYEVKTGLNEGETVATAANFLLDSESRLRGAIQRARKPPPAKPANE